MYFAHKARTHQAARFKDDVMAAMEKHELWNMCYVLRDYWAKLTPRKSKEATGEGTQAGISCHGSMFVFLNPSQAIRNEHDAVSKTTTLL